MIRTPFNRTATAFHLFAATATFCSALAAQPPMHFDCTSGKLPGNAKRLDRSSLYPTAATTAPGNPAACGFDLQPAPAIFEANACLSDKPFFFSVAAPDGDYRVAVTLGGPHPSVTTLRAESRRLLLRY